MISKPETVKWYAPRWSYAPRLWRQLNSVFSLGAMARIVILSGVIYAMIAAGIKFAIPGVVLPPLWRILLIFPGIAVYVLFYMALLVALPQRIIVRRDKVVIEHSQKRVIGASAVLKIWLYAHSSDRLRLKVRYRANSSDRTRVIGVASSVDLDDLCAALPSEPVVRDARQRRFAAGRQEVQAER